MAKSTAFYAAKYALCERALKAKHSNSYSHTYSNY